MIERVRVASLQPQAASMLLILFRILDVQSVRREGVTNVVSIQAIPLSEPQVMQIEAMVSKFGVIYLASDSSSATKQDVLSIFLALGTRRAIHWMPFVSDELSAKKLVGALPYNMVY